MECGSDRLAWGAGDVFLLPGGGAVILRAEHDALLWLVSNEPMLALDGSLPGPAPLPAVHYPASEIERQLAILSGTRSNASSSGLALIFIVQDGGLHYHARTMGFEFLG